MDFNGRALPDVVPLLEQIHPPLHAASHVPYAFFSTTDYKAHQKDLYSASKASNVPLLSYLKGTSTLQPYILM